MFVFIIFVLLLVIISQKFDPVWLKYVYVNKFEQINKNFIIWIKKKNLEKQKGETGNCESMIEFAYLDSGLASPKAHE